MLSFCSNDWLQTQNILFVNTINAEDKLKE